MDFAMESHSNGGYVSSSSSSMTYGQAMGSNDIMGSLRNFLEHSIADMFTDEAPQLASRRSASAPRSRMPASSAASAAAVTGTPDKKALTPRDGSSKQCPGSQRRPQRGRLVQDVGPAKDSHGGLLDVVVSGFSSIGQRATTLLNTLDANIDSMFHPDKHSGYNDDPSSSEGECAQPAPPPPRRLSDDIYLHGPPGPGGSGRSGTGSRRDQSPLPLTATAAAATGPSGGRLVAAGGKAKRGSPKKKLIMVRRSPTAAAAEQPPTSAAADSSVAVEVEVSAPAASVGGGDDCTATDSPKLMAALVPGASAGATCAANGALPPATAMAATSSQLPSNSDSVTGLCASSPTGDSAAGCAAASSPPSRTASAAVPSLASMDAEALRREVLRLRTDVKRLKAELLASEGRCGTLEDENNRLRGAEHHLDPAVSDVVAHQLQALLADKSRLVQRSAVWAAEAGRLHELLAFTTQPPCGEEDISDDVDSVYEAGASTAGNTPAMAAGWEFVGRRRDSAGGCSARSAAVPRAGRDECDMASISALHRHYSCLLYTSESQGAAAAAGAATAAPEAAAAPVPCGADVDVAPGSSATPRAVESPLAGHGAGAAGGAGDGSGASGSGWDQAGRCSPVGKLESRLDAVSTAELSDAASSLAPPGRASKTEPAERDGSSEVVGVAAPAARSPVQVAHDEFFEDLAVHDYVEE